MKTIFIGGSRHVSRLPAEIKHRIDNVINSGHQIIVGDANGADKAVQKYLNDASYDKVTVFCSGEKFRNNVGLWTTRRVDAPKNLKGFQFYAAKDREMAREADFGLMIWDGKSPGTVLNVLRLVRSGKISVLFSVPDKRVINIKTQADWDSFLTNCTDELRHDLQERATPNEWQSGQQQSLLETKQELRPEGAQLQTSATVSSEDELADSLDAALAAADAAAAVSALGDLAKLRGMSNVAKETGLARESLYRALSGSGNPEFATVLKVMSSLGLRLRSTHVR